MAKFTKLDPAKVILGRGRSAQEARLPYVQALKASDAGKIVLDDGDDPNRVKRYLRRAAQDASVQLRSSWEDETRRTLLWKKVRASR